MIGVGGQLRRGERTPFPPCNQWADLPSSPRGFAFGRPLVQVWDFERGKVRLDLPYQAQDDFMMHEEPVLALTFSRDSELLASGSHEGHIKVWRLGTGQCVRRFNKAHSQGITCLAFSTDGTQVASGSFDAVGRVHGLKSGKTTKELRGHTSYINAVVYSPDGGRIVTGSSDGSVRVWDANSSECTGKFVAPTPSVRVELGVNTLAFLPSGPEHLVVCNRSPHVYIFSLAGQLINTLSSGKKMVRLASPPSSTPRLATDHPPRSATTAGTLPPQHPVTSAHLPCGRAATSSHAPSPRRCAPPSLNFASPLANPHYEISDVSVRALPEPPAAWLCRRGIGYTRSLRTGSSTASMSPRASCSTCSRRTTRR